MSRITDETAEFSGQIHRIVVRRDGRRFWLDPAFLYALEHHTKPDLVARLMERFDASRDEAEQLPELLRRAGLIETEGDA